MEVFGEVKVRDSIYFLAYIVCMFGSISLLGCYNCLVVKFRAQIFYFVIINEFSIIYNQIINNSNNLISFNNGLLAPVPPVNLWKESQKQFYVVMTG